ncbi:MAG TPA: isoprenylcysteine carboxylmethyltransferase family protein [Candidatus Acidoferrales bacterium]|nr:isoprenylcysteine carboxylmethyltransferase family protein [Candidatus Acidoferrales bacterium]
MTARRNTLARWRVPVGYPLALLCFWFAKPTVLSLCAGAAVSVIGLAIRASAAGHLRKGEGLATSGPYRRTRNPLYFGSAILAVGFAVAAWSWIVLALILAYMLVFYPAVIRREEIELIARYGAEFEEFSRRVPAFWPRATAGGAAGGTFSWRQYKRNREYQAAVGALFALALLAGRMWLRSKGI